MRRRRQPRCGLARHVTAATLPSSAATTTTAARELAAAALVHHAMEGVHRTATVPDDVAVAASAAATATATAATTSAATPAAVVLRVRRCDVAEAALWHRRPYTRMLVGLRRSRGQGR